MFSLIQTRSDFAPLHSSFSLEKKKKKKKLTQDRKGKETKRMNAPLGTPKVKLFLQHV